jgi:hypothetical protein
MTNTVQTLPLRRRLYGALLSRLYNVQPVIEGCYRSAQPHPSHLQFLVERYGIRTLLNLRGAHPEDDWFNREIDACRSLGVRHENAILNSRWIPRRHDLLELFEAYKSSPRPLLLKCSGGADRTSLASALFIVHRAFETGAARDLEATLARARQQMRVWPYLHLPKRPQRWIPYFLEFFATDYEGLEPLAWTQQKYRWQRFVDYMLERGLPGYWAGPQPGRDAPDPD